MSALRITPLVVVLAVAAACAETPIEPHGSTAPAFAAGGRPYTPGEQQPVVDVSRDPHGILPPDEGQVLRQTFSPTSNQWLGFIELPVACGSGVLLNVKVREGFDGPVLYEVNVAGLPVFADGSMQLIQVFDPRFRHGIKLRRDREYAIELAAFPGPEAVVNSCSIVPGPVGDSYVRGQAFYEDVPANGTGFEPLPNGVVGDHEDLPFVTLVR